MASAALSSGRQRAVYLDYNATTPVDPRVAHKMSRCLMFDGHFGNEAEGDVADDNATDILLIEGTQGDDTIRLRASRSHG